MAFKISDQEKVIEKSVYLKDIIKENQLTPTQRLGFALKVMGGLGLIYLVAAGFFGYFQNSYGKLVFSSTLQLVSNFGAFILGFYFSRK